MCRSCEGRKLWNVRKGRTKRTGRMGTARRRESESKCSLEGGSRWSDWSSALASVGYLGAVQPLLGATPVSRVEGRD